MTLPPPAPDRETWFPVPPEMCGQCTCGEFVETWRNGDAAGVLVEFTCQGCGYVVSKFGHDPLLEAVKNDS